MCEPSLQIGHVTMPYGELAICVGRYAVGDALAVMLRGHWHNREPIKLMFSVNIPPRTKELADNEFFVKAWDENGPLIEPMLATGLFEETGRLVPTGYVFAPVWRIKQTVQLPPQNRRRAPEPQAA